MERSREFVEGLKRELPTWQLEGIVTPGAARALTVRYGLDGSSSPPARDRSGALAAAAGLAVAAALATSLFFSGIGDGVVLPLTALAAAYAATPLVVRGEALSRPASALRVEGRILFYLVAYALSFVSVAEATRFKSGFASQGLVAALPSFAVAALAVVSGLRRPDVDAHARGEAMLLVATVLAFAAGLSLDSGGGTAIVATMALAFLAVGRIVRGLSWRTRPPFVEGVVVAAVLVASHTYTMFPSLWVALAAAIVCLAAAGAALIGFERRRGHPHEAASV